MTSLSPFVASSQFALPSFILNQSLSKSFNTRYPPFIALPKPEPPFPPTSFPGGWWYVACLSINLNGPYIEGPNSYDGEGIIYKSWTGLGYSLNTTSMMIRPTN